MALSQKWPDITFSIKITPTFPSMQVLLHLHKDTEARLFFSLFQKKDSVQSCSALSPFAGNVKVSISANAPFMDGDSHS